MTQATGMQVLGNGGIGGKASGLKGVMEAVEGFRCDGCLPVFVPGFTVISTEFFEEFVRVNSLEALASSEEPDDRIAMAFLRGEMSPLLTGDLWSFISGCREPVAVRSSSLLEDALGSPLAGIYQTKMIPNNQPSDEMRFRKLIEAVKLVWASTYFSASREYHRGIGGSAAAERMAVLLQGVVGRRFGDRFYPAVSGVGRSFNYYAFGRAKPEDGVVNLALGLGKSIVDGGTCWSYSPALPSVSPPYGSINEMMKGTQTSFWAVNMGQITEYDPVKETEYMVSCGLDDADYDDTLRLVASTYDPESDRLVHGVSCRGARVLNFAPILQDGLLPLNDTVRDLLRLCTEAAGSQVEIEFAVRSAGPSEPAALGLVQVRAIAASSEAVEIPACELEGERTLAVSRKALGNGITRVEHVVYVKPESFNASATRAIASEIASLNREMAARKAGYLLIGYGRWGSSDPWLGIPVNWGQISGARAIIEVSGAGIRAELSQGSHFFHNLSSFGVGYLSVSEAMDGAIDWDWLASCGETVAETTHVRCVRTPDGLCVKIDGRTGFGAVLR